MPKCEDWLKKVKHIRDLDYLETEEENIVSTKKREESSIKE